MTKLKTFLSASALTIVAAICEGKPIVPNTVIDGIEIEQSSHMNNPILILPNTYAWWSYEDTPINEANGDYNDLFGVLYFSSIVNGQVYASVAVLGGLSSHVATHLNVFENEAGGLDVLSLANPVGGRWIDASDPSRAFVMALWNPWHGEGAYSGGPKSWTSQHNLDGTPINHGAVPEPSTWLLLSSGVALLFLGRLKKVKNNSCISAKDAVS